MISPQRKINEQLNSSELEFTIYSNGLPFFVEKTEVYPVWNRRWGDSSVESVLQGPIQVLSLMEIAKISLIKQLNKSWKNEQLKFHCELRQNYICQTDLEMKRYTDLTSTACSALMLPKLIADFIKIIPPYIRLTYFPTHTTTITFPHREILRHENLSFHGTIGSAAVTCNFRIPSVFHKMLQFHGYGVCPS